MDKNDYLTYKRKERLDQLRLQQSINDAVPTNGECLINSFH
jgi:hypothetical protein